MHQTLTASDRDMETLGAPDRFVELKKGEAPLLIEDFVRPSFLTSSIAPHVF